MEKTEQEKAQYLAQAKKAVKEAERAKDYLNAAKKYTEAADNFNLANEYDSAEIYMLEAATNWAMVCDEYPRNKEFLSELARLYNQLGHWFEAGVLWEEIIDLETSYCDKLKAAKQSIMAFTRYINGE